MEAKSEMTDKPGPSVGSEDTWTYEIPFHYAWVSAEATETCLDPEAAAAFMEREFPSVCRVRIDLAAPNSQEKVSRVRAWQLHASCPFCDAGKDQLLDSGNWINVFEWDKDLEGDLLRYFPILPRGGSRTRINIMHDHGGLERALNWRLFTAPMRSWALEACLAEHPHVAREECPELESITAWDPSEGINAYGVSLAEVLAVLEGDKPAKCSVRGNASSSYEAEPIAKEFGVEGYFDGLYRCAHCGNAFAVDYRDPCDDTRDGRYKILPEVSRVIDRLVARRGLAEAVSDECALAPAHASTMSVHVSKEGSRITLRANIAGQDHELVFDTELGSFLLDGDAYIDDNLAARKPLPHLELHRIYEHPLIADCLAEMPGLVLRLLGMLPPLPEGVDASPSKLLGREYAINLLIAANRFVGYPAEFYNEMARSDTAWASTSGLASAYPFDTGLLRDYSQIDTFFEQTGLPDNERLKRLLLNRPQLVMDVLQNPDLPFESPEALACLFQLPRITFVLRMLRFRPKSVAGWRRLVEAKGEEAVFRYIEDQAERANVLDSLPADERLCDVSCFLDALCDHATDEQLASVRMGRLHEDLAALMEGL